MPEVLVKIQPPDHPVHMPEPAVFSPQVEAEIDRHLAKYPIKRSAILPLMFIVQRERGYLDPPGVQYWESKLARPRQTADFRCRRLNVSARAARRRCFRSILIITKI